MIKLFCRLQYVPVFIILCFIGCNRKDFLNPTDPINFPLPPILAYPTGDILIYDNPPTFYWGLIDTSFDLVYEIQGAENSTFDNPIFSTIVYSYGDTVCFYQPDELLKEHCFWRVRARVGGASDKAWGEWTTGSFYERFPLVAEYEDIPEGNKIIIKDNYAYVMDKPQTFHILDVSNPAEPEFISSFTDSVVSNFYDIKKEGNYLYLTCRNINYDYFLRIYSISNSSSPQFTGACSLRYSPGCLAVSYPAVYIEQDYGTIAIIDISDPTNPFEANSIDIDYNIYGIVIKENYLLVFTSSQIKVYNITNPFYPYLINNYSHYIDKFCISGDTLFATNNNYPYNITIFDVSALPTLKKIGSFSTDYYSFYEICFSSDCLAVRHSDGVSIFELSKYKKPEEGKLYPSSYTYSIASNKGYLYLISYDGMRVVKLCE